MVCIDYHGNEIEEYFPFQPTVDPCYRCQCINGTKDVCSAAACSPRLPECNNYIADPTVCCGYTCDINGNDAKITKTQLGAIIIASVVAILLLMYVVYRYKAKRDVLCLKTGRRRGYPNDSSIRLQGQWGDVHYALGPPAYDSPDFTASASLPPAYCDVFHRMEDTVQPQNLDSESGDSSSRANDSTVVAGGNGRNLDGRYSSGQAA